MSDTWDSMASFWDSHEDVKTYSDNAYTSLTTVIGLDGKRVLDFGCGTGLLTHKIANHAHEVFAIDSSPKMIAVLKSKKIPNITSYCDLLSNDFIKDHSNKLQKFDLIVASSVCAFLENYTEILVMLKSLLKPNGLFIQWDWLTSQSKVGEGFNQESVSKAFTTVGLKTKSMTIPFALDDQKVLMAVGVNH